MDGPHENVAAGGVGVVLGWPFQSSLHQRTRSARHGRLRFPRASRSVAAPASTACPAAASSSSTRGPSQNSSLLARDSDSGFNLLVARVAAVRVVRTRQARDLNPELRVPCCDEQPRRAGIRWDWAAANANRAFLWGKFWLQGWRSWSWESAAAANRKIPSSPSLLYPQASRIRSGLPKDEHRSAGFIRRRSAGDSAYELDLSLTH